MGRLRAIADSGRIRKILFIRTDRIGDMVVSTPALRAIKKALPHAMLTVLASRSNAPLLHHDPYVDEVIVWNQGRKAASPIGFLRQVGCLDRVGYDVAIDPMTGGDICTALIAYLSGARLRIGFPGYGREVFFNRLADHPDGWHHMVDVVLETTALLGASPEDRMPRLYLLPAERDWASGWIDAHNPDRRTLVGIHPGGYYPTQRWPADYYAQLACGLKQDLGCQVVLIGGPGDLDQIRSILASANDRFAVFQSADLRQTAAIISHLDGLACNNSGPLHIATALNVATMSFMGPSEQKYWMPLGDHHKVFRQDCLECIGCNRGTCDRGDHACMRRIKPEEALDGMRHLLKREHATSPELKLERCLRMALHPGGERRNGSQPSVRYDPPLRIISDSRG